ncbi:hypothetical protein NIES2107_59630 [Nostoc carneum NIES-2107]|nr:hypothetical protein NIES2107_59630 [Nostoc carneum NIES-2107]
MFEFWIFLWQQNFMLAMRCAVEAKPINCYLLPAMLKDLSASTVSNTKLGLQGSNITPHCSQKSSLIAQEKVQLIADFESA